MKAASHPSLTASCKDQVSIGTSRFAPDDNFPLVLNESSSSSMNDEEDLDEISTKVLLKETHQPIQTNGTTSPVMDTTTMRQTPAKFPTLPILNDIFMADHTNTSGKNRPLIVTGTQNTSVQEENLTSIGRRMRHRRDLPLLAPILVSEFLASSTAYLSIIDSSTDILAQNMDKAYRDDPDLDSLVTLLKDSATSLGVMLVSDILHVCLRYGLPQKWLVRELYRSRSRGGFGRFLLRKPTTVSTNVFGTATTPLRRGTMTERQRHDHIATALSRKAIHGIKNYGQTCFLNSVLQSLAGLPQFMLYLERIVQLQSEQQQHPNFDGQSGDDEKEESATTLRASLSEFLLEALLFLNGSGGRSSSSIQPRELLYRIGQKHPQFKSRYGHGRNHVGTEQQDAQEVLQALVDMIITDSNVDYNTSSVEPSASSMFPLPEKVVHKTNNHGVDRILSLSCLLEKADCVDHQDSLDTPLSTFDHHSNEKLEEKKQEDFEINGDGSTGGKLTEITKEQHPSQTALEKGRMSPNQSVDISASMQLTPAMKSMLNSISPTSPSPLTGWIGSTLQCCECYHVRPIRNAPFLDIAIVPTSVSRYMSSPMSPGQSPASTFPACTLSQCLDDFTSIERVHDVECLSCTIKREMEKLEEEIFMLRGAIDTILSRLRKKGIVDGRDEQVKTLRNELNEAEIRKFQLLTMDPDDTEEWESMNNSTMVEESFMDTDEFLGTQCTTLHRGHAKKCLLLTRLPSVLCFHVQRRYYDPVRDTMCKAMQHLDFPETLDLRPHCAYGGQSSSWVGQTTSPVQTNLSEGGLGTKPILYRLMSVIEHRGNAHAGHYQAYRRAPEASAPNGWVLVSDLDVTPLQWKDVQRAQAYMLFYEKI